jgi:hypothetical protein
MFLAGDVLAMLLTYFPAISPNRLNFWVIVSSLVPVGWSTRDINGIV